MNQNNLPKGWKIAKLGEVAISQKGKKPKNFSSEKNTVCNIPYVNIKAFERNIIDEYTDGKGCVLCDEGDFLMVWDGARSGYVGKAIKGAIGSTLVKRSFPDINLNFAYYFLFSKYLQINTKAKGTGIPHVDPNLLWNFDFPLPPIIEQHQIVAKIEELFMFLDKGIESLKTAQTLLKLYRQAVLKYAFEGKLTNKNVVDGELPKGWEWKKISDVAFINPKLPFENIDEIKKYSQVKKGFTPMTDGDVIFAKITPCMENGKIAVVNSLKNKIAFGSTEFHVFRCKENCLNNYLFQYLVQEKTRQKAANNMTGAVGQRRVPKKFLEDYLIPIPKTLSEQQKIVQEIESRLSVCDKIEESIITSLKQAELLRQSILKQAFEGKLLNTNINT